MTRKQTDHNEKEAGEDNGPRPVWSLVAVLLAVIAILALAFVNLDSSGPTDSDKTGASRDNDGNAVSTTAPGVPSFDVVRISQGGTGVLAGRAAPGSQVQVLVNGEPVAGAQADRNGEWVLILEQPLPFGTVEMSLVARATPDGEAVESDDVVVVSIPEPPESERFSRPADEGVVAVLTPRSGEGGSRIMQKPGLAAPGEVGDSLTVDSIDYGADGQTVFAGRGLPRSNVRVYLDNEFIGEERASDEGRWSVAMRDTPVEGPHELRVDQVVGEGRVQLRILQPFSTGVALNPDDAESRVVVNPGDTLWAIARQLYGRGTRYTLIFQENSENITDPDLIFPGQKFKLPRPANGETAPPASTH